MTSAVHVFEQILPRWRAVLPPEVPRPYFDRYVVRNRGMLIDLIGAWLERREERRAISAPESMTPAARTRRNLEAMRLVATKKPEDMTAEERRILLGYSGWGGLSIEGVADQFPPGLVPSDFALAHEYFTPNPIAEAIADLVCRLLPELAGYDGVVRGFEPSVGIGRFVRPLGPPRCLVTDPRYKSIHWTAVELSEVSAKMFAAIRPDVDLYVMSLEQWMSEHAARFQGIFNLAVANPPYGDRGEFALKDKHPDYQETKAYAYFLRRVMDLLVPRGLGIFVIPAGFLTGPQNRGLREKVLLRHHLEVAFRLPSESTRGKDLFPGARNVVDVVVLRARGGELGAVDAADQSILEGRYFDEYPDHVLGTEIKVDPKEKTRRDRYRVIGDFTGFPAYEPRPACRTCALHDLPVLTAVHTESVVRDLGDDPEDAPDDLRLALALGRRVDRYLALVAAENTKALGLWPELHAALESFQRIPALHPHKNPWLWPELQHLAKRRPAAARLLAAYQRTGELAPSVATAPNIQPKYRARPDDVLAQAEYLYRARRHLSTAELLTFHREQGGRMDARTTLAAVLDAGWCLDGEGWDELVPGADYVTGRLWPRHDLAAARAKADPQAARQLQRLQGVMNLAVFEDIRDVSPRQGWVPLDLVSSWLGEGPNQKYGPVELERDRGIVHPAGALYGALGRTDALTPDALWFIGWMNHDAKLFKPKLEDDEVKALIAEEEAATGRPWRLEQDDPSTKDKGRDEDEDDSDADDDEDDPNLGELRLLLGHRWDRQFAAWVAANEARRAVVTNSYNRSFRGTVIPTFEASTLEIARWNEHGPQLKAHQIAGALRINHFGFGLVAFDVGVGKSFTAIAGVALARQEGRVRRPVFLVPSSLVWQWYDNFMCVLPDYRVAVIGSKRKELSRGKNRGQITSEPDTPEERAEKWTALQAGLLDVVILSYDALGRTKMNEEALLAYVEKVGAIQRQVALRQRNAKKKAQSKLTEREKAILSHGVRAFIEEQLELPPDRKYDPGIAWDEIGIDMLVVDEAAAFKNSYKPEPREHGLPKYMGSSSGSSKRAWQLDFRAAAVRRHTKGPGIVLLTATPAKNSPLEFYNLIQLMDPWAFSGRGLMDPEQFIDRFLQIESRQVVDVTLRPATRSVVAGFKNLDDLRTIIHTYGEFRSAEQVHLRIPEPRSELVRVSMNAEQVHLYGRLVRKINELIAKPGSGRSKILGLLVRLSVIALHPELDGGVEYDEALAKIDPAAYAAPKLLACADRIVASAGCGHIVFCEPTAVHLWLREVLVARGIPRETIAILNAIETTPAQRNRIAREFNGVVAETAMGGACAATTTEYTRPRYNVIIANSVANEGLDLQRRTCAMHHLDLPWTSADLEQRNGRAVRQGNQLDVVQIYYYLTDRSMDWFRYSTIQGKRAWLSVVLESQARDTSNPGAQQNLSDEDILMMISQDPEATQAALERRRAAERALANAKIAREAANLLIQASARFRDARDTTDPEKAARLRGEGDTRLKDLRRVDVAAWPWGKWADHAREVEMLVASAEAAPVFEGLRVGQGPPAERRFMEFGRVVDGERGVEIGKRDHGAPLWQLLDTTEVRDMRLQPAELDAGSEWPAEDDAELLTDLQAHITRSLVDGAPFAALQWRGASDAWLSRWWPRVEPQIRGALATRPERTESPLVRTSEGDPDEAKYPLVIDEKLTLGAGPALRRGELLAPTLAGWRQFLDLAPRSGLKRAELRKVAVYFWERSLPQGLALAPGDSAGDRDVDVAPARRSEKLLPEPTTPRAAPQIPPTWADKVIARFDATPGFRLRLVQRGASRSVFAVDREGRAGEVVASIDIVAHEIEDVRWLDDRLRAAEQTDIVDRLTNILLDMQAEESAKEEESPPDSGSLDPLIRMLERVGGERLGMDLKRTLRGSSKQTLARMTAELHDLAVPETASPLQIAGWLRDQDFFDAAEVLEDPAKLAYSSITALLDELWAAIDGYVPVAQIQRKSGAVLVAEGALMQAAGVGQFVLVRDDGKDRRYRLRRVPVTSTCDPNGSCTIAESAGERLTRGAEVYLAETPEPFITELHERIGNLEDTLRRAPSLLADVRRLLVLTGALVDTQRCQGKEEAAALRAFEQAKAYHDAARRLLIEGKTAVAAERIHDAMRRIATAAAHIAQNCAAGQQDIVPATLPVSPDDAATLEEV